MLINHNRQFVKLNYIILRAGAINIHLCLFQLCRPSGHSDPRYPRAPSRSNEKSMEDRAVIRARDRALLNGGISRSAVGRRNWIPGWIGRNDVAVGHLPVRPFAGIIPFNGRESNRALGRREEERRCRRRSIALPLFVFFFFLF